MKLICYSLHHGNLPEIRPAPRPRQWMDETHKGYANKCLPMAIANQCGWQILNMAAFTAIWDGQAGPDAVRIVGDPGDTRIMPKSLLGSGLLSFTVPCLFRTESGHNLWIGGPVNEVKPGLQALTAIVEADWLPFHFTMNWKFVRPNEPVRFEKDEPFCQVFPFPRSLVESVDPVFRRIGDDPELQSRWRAWNEARGTFTREMRIEGSLAHQAGWQKHYTRGETIEGERFADHQTKLKLREFRWEAG